MQAREADYRALAEQARAVASGFPRRGPVPAGRRGELAGQLARLRHRTAELAEIDFFGAPGREVVEGLLSGLEARMRTVEGAEPSRPVLESGSTVAAPG
ncbi:MAG TPA: hypothetical protein VFL83_14585 [Anaeromyxobacter sp.]|nr:hypothetical protein [Anaeromyxobacter sp.]